MRNRIQHVAAIALTAGSIAVAGCGGGGSRQASNANGDVTTSNAAGSAAVTPAAPMDSTSMARAPQHHSKLAGAALGAVAGHALGGHAVLGAAAGALVQHERNKRQR
ncbi:MAG TPA: hypothetical protein VGG84_16820 [Gemmatimonadaceae bacterium]